MLQSYSLSCRQAEEKKAMELEDLIEGYRRAAMDFEQKYPQDIEDNPRYYVGPTTICTRMNMRLQELGLSKKEHRLAFVSMMVGRQIESTKKLSVGEVLAMNNQLKIRGKWLVQEGFRCNFQTTLS